MATRTQEYKGYKIIVQYNFGVGDGYSIIKHVKGRDFLLNKKDFSFNNTDVAFNRACMYINRNFSDLNEVFQKEFIAFTKRLKENPQIAANTKIDLKYYLKAYRALQDKNLI